MSTLHPVVVTGAGIGVVVTFLLGWEIVVWLGDLRDRREAARLADARRRADYLAEVRAYGKDGF